MNEQEKSLADVMEELKKEEEEKKAQQKKKAQTQTRQTRTSIQTQKIKDFSSILVSGNSSTYKRLSQNFKNVLNNVDRREWVYNLRDKVLRIDQPVIMGILNVTPDSFSDGGKYLNAEDAYQHAQKMIEAGAQIIDIGGESTRPGSRQVDLDEELARTIPLINAIREISEIPISIDTNKSGVMQAAVAAGASIINSIWALQLDDSMQVAADLGVSVVLMHMQGSPETMQQNPVYTDVVGEVKDFLKQRIDAALDAGRPDPITHQADIGIQQHLGDNDNSRRSTTAVCCDHSICCLLLWPVASVAPASLARTYARPP